MNSKLLLLSATLLGGVLSTTASATTADAHAAVTRGLKLSAPAVAHVVSPAGLSRRFEGANVTLTMTVDADGRAHDIRLVSHRDARLEESLVNAVSQWQFTPAKKNGVPFSAKVVLPLQLVES